MFLNKKCFRPLFNSASIHVKLTLCRATTFLLPVYEAHVSYHNSAFVSNFNSYLFTQLTLTDGQDSGFFNLASLRYSLICLSFCSVRSS